MNKIRVMVVDDSALMRKMISGILMKDPELEVVSTAMDGLFALKKIPQSRPDVITLDLDMPRMDGLTALRVIVQEHHLPVVLVSSLTTSGGHLTFDGLALGAVDFVTKPKDAISVHLHEVADELIRKVKAAGHASVSKIRIHEVRKPSASPSAVIRRERGRESFRKIVAIGISTGGPNAISYFLPRLPADFPAPILIVQHMPEGFTGLFADRLNHICNIEVSEARDGDQLLPGAALIAPANRHLKVTKFGRGGIAVLSASPPVNGHRPSADVLFESVSQEYGADCIGVIMTGMGEDGARGLGTIKARGGHTLAQNEETCVVYGMPKAAREMGHVREVVSLDDVSSRLRALVQEVTVYAGEPDKAV
jgi:two-component system chemotaxis response regulator CheB